MLPRMRLAPVLLVVVLGCQSGTAAPKVTANTPLAIDLKTICNAIELSGATTLAGTDQAYTIAQWLPVNVSDDGRKWLVSWAKLGEDKVARHRMLELDARAAGVIDCPLLVQWK